MVRLELARSGDIPTFQLHSSSLLREMGQMMLVRQLYWKEREVWRMMQTLFCRNTTAGMMRRSVRKCMYVCRYVTRSCVVTDCHSL